MNRKLTALFSALEALLVLAIGVAIPLVPLTALWAFQYGLQVDWVTFWRAAVDLWLLGSGVDIRMTLDPTIATGLGFTGAGAPFALTIAPLGFALLTVLLGARAGRRIGETPYRLIGVLAAVATFAVLSLAITLSALLTAARPSISQGTILPTLVFALGVVVGSEIGRSRSDSGQPRLGWLERRNPQYHAMTVAALRSGTASAGVVIAASAVILAVLFVANYAAVITLYETAHAGVLGGITLTIAQLALLPNLVLWTASWMIGPGFAVGTGSSVSPFATALGPIPAVPILGALPEPGTLAWGFLGLLVPVLAAFFVAVLLRPRLVRTLGGVAALPSLLVAGALSGVVGGIVLGLLAWASGGSAGPGRLVDVGPTPWLVGLYAALEIGLASMIGYVAGRPRRE